MSNFTAGSDSLREARERDEQLASGEKLVPVSAAIVAVFAAVATLFANHSSVSGLEKRTLAGITQTRAADRYNSYEASLVKVEVNQALAASGLLANPAALHSMQDRIASQESVSSGTLKAAEAEEASAKTQLDQAERSLGSYEKYEISATLFDVSIVLVSITALMRKSKVTFWLGGVLTLIGVGYFVAGLNPLGLLR